jgi:hypothetical protein
LLPSPGRTPLGPFASGQRNARGGQAPAVGRIAEDLRVETGSARGFSRRHLFYMRRFAVVWPEAEKVQTLSARIGWSHHQVLLDATSARLPLTAGKSREAVARSRVLSDERASEFSW